MDFIPILHDETNITALQFWTAIEIWSDNPHVVNRRILTCSNMLSAEIKCNPLDIVARLTKSQCPMELSEHNMNMEDILQWLHISQINTNNELGIVDSVNYKVPDSKAYLCIKKLLSRNSRILSPTIEFIIANKKLNTITYIHKSVITKNQSIIPIEMYSIGYEHNGRISVSVGKFENILNNPSVEWMRTKFYPRFKKWMKSENSSNNTLSYSLSLVSREKYAKLYNELKNKYSTKLVNMWPECTDPSKFVYEDIAIASYLLLLWEKERYEKGITKRQSFLDLGCGNGLLVYILSSEGHEGTGIDLRQRKIWNLYPQDIRLMVRTVVPSDSSLFPEVDWIIGNHSDELTPWIPVIAARSSYNCRFFLLPCCAYEFNSKKYQRDDASKSQYSEYISYIKNVSEVCGFHTLIDRLRIPSTRRICLIGWERTYPEEETKLQDDRIEEIINARSNSSICQTANRIDANDHTESISSWSSEFKARDTTERVRNCTQLDKTITAKIVDIVVSKLLEEEHKIEPEGRVGTFWNAGRELELHQVANSIPSEILKQLRSECGGLQTLLRNHNHIFDVTQGKVQFRIPGANRNTDKKSSHRRKKVPALKTKPCWFHENHPDGCPLVDAKCPFKHRANT